MKIYYKKNNFISTIKKSILFLPVPININSLWRIGSILGSRLITQIISGLFLSIHYTPHVNYAFNRIIHIIHDINYGWLIRLIHINGASSFFFFIFIHIGRGLYFNSYYLNLTWYRGSLIFIITIATAFLGYVLPWGQISFWGATVITNLISAIPFIGNNIVVWLWGGFRINNATLNRFYSLHFILPFIILIIIFIHLITLHITGSRNPLGTNGNLYKIPFHLYHSIKDFQRFILKFFLLLCICCLNPYILRDPENFRIANSIITPIHIQPEWYFLFAYAILRSIPNKLGGVIALLISVIILLIIPLYNINKFQRSFYYPINQLTFWIFINIIIILTWIGIKPIEYPYILIGQILTLFYFIYFLFNPLIFKIWNLILIKNNSYIN